MSRLCPEVTAAMVEAGVGQLLAFDSEDLRFSAEAAVRSIYTAMREVAGKDIASDKNVVWRIKGGESCDIRLDITADWAELEFDSQATADAGAGRESCSLEGYIEALGDA